jgi:hypothetical protein
VKVDLGTFFSTSFDGLLGATMYGLLCDRLPLEISIRKGPVPQWSAT